MEELTKFSEQLSALIKENETLKNHIKRTEEWFKLAIAVNNKLQFRTKESVDELMYETFLSKTFISYSGEGISLVWSDYKPVNFDGRSVLGLAPVTIEEIEAIFKGQKLF